MDRAARHNTQKSCSSKTLHRGLCPSVRAPRNPRSIPYRVTYTWNRGGRLKELRIRHLARKFLHAWVRKTFGRVLPSTARLHHGRRLLRSCFGRWAEVWWVLRKEWKFSVRADCHYSSDARLVPGVAPLADLCENLQDQTAHALRGSGVQGARNPARFLARVDGPVAAQTSGPWDGVTGFKALGSEPAD
ncbi:hypothetical protein FKM82_005111 [Ascaphus truei]